MSTVNLGTLVTYLRVDTSGFEKGVGGAVNKGEKSLERFASKAASVAKAAAVGFVGLGGAVAVAIKSASDLEENMNVLESSFGEKLTPSVLKWAKVTAESVGRSQAQMREFAGTMQAMLVPMLGSRKAASQLSMELSTLAVDLGSFYNVADDDALLALRSAIVGETEPMRRFGVVMTQTALDAFLLNKGINKQFKELTEAGKAMVRYEFLMRETKLAQGDAAKTSGSFANVVKAIRGLLRDLADEIGQSLLPVFSDLALMIRDTLRWFMDLSPEAKNFTAKALLAGTAVLGLTAALGGAAAAFATLKPIVIAIGAKIGAGFLAALPAIAAVAAGVAGLILIIGAVRKAYKANAKAIADTFKALAEYLQGMWSTLSRTLADSVSAAMEKAILMKSLLSGESPDEAFRLIQQLRKEGVGGALFSDLGKLEGLGTKLEASLESLGEHLGDNISDVWQEGVETIKGMAGKMSPVLKMAISKIINSVVGAFGEDPMKGRRKKRRGVPGAGDLEFKQKDFKAKGRIVVPEILGDIQRRVEQREFKARTSRAPVFETIDTGSFRNVLTAAALDLKSGITRFAADVGRTLLDSAGDIGGMVNTAMQGFQSGGPFGAIAAVVSDLITRSEAFQNTVEHGNRAMEGLVDAFEPLAEAMQPLAVLTHELIGVIAGQLKPVFEALTPVFSFLFKIMKAVAVVIMRIVKAIGDAWNAIIRGVQAFLKGIGLGGFAKRLNRLKINMNGMNRALDNINSITVSSAKEAVAATAEEIEEKDKLAETVRGLNEALTNVPEGFKVQAARFSAIDAAQDVAATPAVESGGVMINITANDADSVADAVERVLTERNFARTGTTNRSVSRFAVR